MGGDIAPACSSCEEPVGPPDQEIHKVDDDNPPDDPHFKEQQREDGETRLQCLNTGQLASVITPDDPEHPMNKEEGEPEGSRGVGNSSESDGGEVFDLPKDKTQIDVLQDVVTNSHYGLKDEQISEIRDWAMDYDGQMPPSVLEKLLDNMKGVQSQTAKLIREKYELKLNKWRREQSKNDDGPPIGALTGRMGGQMGTSPQPRPATPTPKNVEKDDNQDDDDDISFGDIGKSRRQRRVDRRQNVMDTMAEEVAEEAAPMVAQELVGNLGTYFGLPATVLEAKIKKDPDWVFEKAEQFDIDLMHIIDELMEPSDERKKELKMKARGETEVDQELDDAVQDIESDGKSEEINKDERWSEDVEADPNQGETVNNRQTVEQPTPDSSENDQDSPNDKDEAFEELFGDGDETTETQEVN